MKLEIKKEHLNTQIAYNGSGLPLGLREDHEVLAELAIKNDAPHLKQVFKKLPTLEELAKMKGEQFLKENPAPAAEEVTEATEAAETTKPENKKNTNNKK